MHASVACAHFLSHLSSGISLSFDHVRERTGLVTDGSVRDTDILREYGFPVFSHSTTAKQGPAAMQPWEANGVVECGGVVVRPGDAIIGDQDGETLLPCPLLPCPLLPAPC